MKKENVIDLVTHTCKDDCISSTEPSSISKELEQAIQHLIYRLRELGPIN
jgi:hypothetical protein